MVSRAQRKKNRKARVSKPISLGRNVVVDVTNDAAKREAAAVAMGLVDTMALEAARCGEAVAMPKAGPVRLTTRDGLASLEATSSLTKGELVTAMAYRLLFETAGVSSGLGSQLADRTHGVRSSTDGAIIHGLFRAYAGVRLTNIDADVALADRTNRALNMLRGIAGEGLSLNTFGRGGNARTANLNALRMALVVAADRIERDRKNGKKRDGSQGGLRIGAQ